MPKPENGLIFERNSKGKIIGSYSKKQHNLKLSKGLNDILFRTKGIDANLKVKLMHSHIDAVMNTSSAGIQRKGRF